MWERKRVGLIQLIDPNLSSFQDFSFLVVDRCSEARKHDGDDTFDETEKVPDIETISLFPGNEPNC